MIVIITQVSSTPGGPPVKLYGMKALIVVVSGLLLACGNVLKIEPDAPPPVDASPDARPAVTRLYAVSAAQLDFSTVSKISLDVIDLRTTTLDRHVELGFAGLSATAVSPDAATIYVADFSTGEVRFLSTTTGAIARTVPLAQVRDIVLDASGGKLYAAAGSKIVAIDTATGTTTPSPDVGGASITLGIALSPDGARIGTSTTNGGSNPTITLVRTSDMSIENAIPIVTNVGGCSSSPAAVAFKSNGLLVTWDLNCDALYQVDVGTHTQLTAGSIATGRDSGASFMSSNKLTTSASSGLAYAIKEDANLAVMNTQNTTFTQLPMAAPNTDTPFASGMSGDGARLFVSIIHRFNGGGADTLTTIDTATSGVTPNAFTLMSATQSVVSMKAVTSL